jgi:hypothetical protein
MVHARLSALALLTVTAALGVAACGGQRQDADEPSGQFHVAVAKASFPSKQAIAQRATLRIAVTNKEPKREIPHVAVTVETRPHSGGAAPLSFGQADTTDSRLADDGTPVWILDTPPKGGESAYTNTWALGPMFAGETKTFEWHLVAVRPGDYDVTYRVSPGLTGKAKAAQGERDKGSLRVHISSEPVPAHVGADGQVIRGEEAGSTSSSGGQ